MFGYLIDFLVFFYLGFYIIPTYVNKFIQFVRRNKVVKEKVIYLTFDDGPSIYTSKLLDLLRKYKIKATFFMVASFSLQNENIVDKIKSDGHLIGFHSFK